VFGPLGLELAAKTRVLSPFSMEADEFPLVEGAEFAGHGNRALILNQEAKNANPGLFATKDEGSYLSFQGLVIRGGG